MSERDNHFDNKDEIVLENKLNDGITYRNSQLKLFDENEVEWVSNKLHVVGEQIPDDEILFNTNNLGEDFHSELPSTEQHVEKSILSGIATDRTLLHEGNGGKKLGDNLLTNFNQPLQDENKILTFPIPINIPPLNKLSSKELTESNPSSPEMISHKKFKEKKTFQETNLNDFIKLLMTENVEEQQTKFPEELTFLSEILQHENAMPNDIISTHLFQQFKFTEFVTMFFTLTAIGSGIVYFEMKSSVEYFENSSVINDKLGEMSLQIDVCLLICSISNMLFIICSFFRYFQLVELKRSLKDFTQAQNFCNTYQWVYLSVEILFACLHPNMLCKNIHIETEDKFFSTIIKYSLNDILIILTLLRSYVLFRFIIAFSDFYSERAERVTKMFGGNLSRIFALKCLLNVHPFIFLTIFSLSFTVLLGYMIKIIEGPIYNLSIISRTELNDFRYLSNTLWYILITMATLGYGDYYPKTDFGRFIGICAAFTGTMFVSVLVICLKQTLDLNFIQYKSVEFIDRVNQKSKIKQKASYFFFYTFRYLVAKSKYLKELAKKEKDESKLDQYKKELTHRMYERITHKKTFKRMLHNFRNVFDLPNEFEPITTKIDDMKKRMKEVEDKGEKLYSQVKDLKRGVSKLVKYKQKYEKLLADLNKNN